MKIDRQLAILSILLENKKTTAPQLAARLEVTRRTIGRDINDLCQAGFPIVTTQGVGGGISIKEGYKLDRRLLTKPERENIRFGLKGLQTVAAGHKEVEHLLNKIEPSLESEPGDDIQIDLASHYGESLKEKIAQIRTAKEQNRLISFTYYGPHGQSHRRVEPYFVTFKWNDWYLFGYCVAKKDFRLFKLNRLWELQTLTETFIPREIPPNRANLDRYFTSQFHLVLKVDPAAECFLVEEWGPDSYTTDASGKLHFQRDFTDLSYTLRWVLSFGAGAQVLAPKELKDLVAQHTRKMGQLY